MWPPGAALRGSPDVFARKDYALALGGFSDLAPTPGGDTASTLPAIYCRYRSPYSGSGLGWPTKGFNDELSDVCVG